MGMMRLIGYAAAIAVLAGAGGVVTKLFTASATPKVVTFQKEPLATAAPYAKVMSLKGCSSSAAYTALAGKAFVLFNAGAAPMSLTSDSTLVPAYRGVFAPGAWVKYEVNGASAPQTATIVARRSTCPAGSTGNIVKVTYG